MASPHQKRKQLNAQAGNVTGSSSGSYAAPVDVFGLSSQHDGRKRRKENLSWEKFTLTPYFDGHLWRKYGHKKIKGSPFPRLYYRCSYSEDKQCMASKLLQQQNHDDPPLFKVTYIHEHTCNAAPIPAPDILAEAETLATSGGVVLSFGSCDISHCDARMQLGQQYPQHQSMPWMPLEMPSLDSWNSQMQKQPVFHFDIPPTMASPPFLITEAMPASPLTNDGGDMFSARNSFTYGLDSRLDHLQFDDHLHFPGSKFSWEVDLDAFTGIDEEQVIF